MQRQVMHQSGRADLFHSDAIVTLDDVHSRYIDALRCVYHTVHISISIAVFVAVFSSHLQCPFYLQPHAMSGLLH